MREIIPLYHSLAAGFGEEIVFLLYIFSVLLDMMPSSVAFHFGLLLVESNHRLRPSLLFWKKGLVEWDKNIFHLGFV